jgi:hypothetical protein
MGHESSRDAVGHAGSTVDTIPFSRAAARGRIGPDWFDRSGWAARPAGTHAGILDSIDVLKSPVFDCTGVDPEVRRFYESTADYDLRLRAHHRAWMLLPLFVWGALGRLVGQTEFPHGDVALSSRFVAMADGADHPARYGSRGWVRTWGRGGRRVLYAIIIAWHEIGRLRCMHTAVPVPGGNLASVMLMLTIEGGGIRHTTRDDAEGAGLPTGVYFATRRRATRLPLHERLDTLPTHAGTVSPGLREFAGAADVVATHTFALFGRPILTLEYAFARRSGSTGLT